MNRFIYLSKKAQIVPKTARKEKITFDVNYDFPLILASFKAAYNIDLKDEENKLSWKQFNDYLSGLPDDSVLTKTIQIRRMPNPNPKKDGIKKYREIMKLKAAHALPIKKEWDMNAKKEYIKIIHSINFGNEGEK